MIEELLKVAALLKTVSVTGEYWTVMQACLNSVLKVAEELKKNEVNNEHKS